MQLKHVAIALVLAASVLRCESPARAASALPSPLSGVDKTYVSAISQDSKKMIALCNEEIATGTRPSLVATAKKILTIEQENEEYMRAYEAEFNIEHSP